ncbi:MAG: sugar phosphate nucleotidyltransferase, partial [bacterium]
WTETKGNRWINAGIYVFNKSVLDMIPADMNYSLERQVFPGILESGRKMSAFKSEFYWLDIGKLDKYRQANFDVLEKRFKTDEKEKKPDKDGVVRGKNLKISRSAFLKGPAVIGNNVQIEKRALVAPLSIIGENCTIGENCIIENSIIWDGAVIMKNAVIKNCIIGKNCVIKSNVMLHGAVLGDSSKATEYSKTGVL